MHARFIVIVFISAVLCSTAREGSAKGLPETNSRLTYISEYYQTAIRLQQKYKIPASIILAQALLESDAGQSYLALAGNNHFGIKCVDWKGVSVTKHDDAKNDCFRKYLDVADSFEDYSRFLSERHFYRKLFSFEITDYKSWANGLKECGYATDPKYAAKLIQIIEDYQLYYYDKAKVTDPPVAPKSSASKK